MPYGSAARAPPKMSVNPNASAGMERFMLASGPSGIAHLPRRHDAPEPHHDEGRHQHGNGQGRHRCGVAARPLVKNTDDRRCEDTTEAADCVDEADPCGGSGTSEKS